MKFIISDSFKFQNDQRSDYFYELFCPVSQNSVITHSSNKKLKLPFQKTKSVIQSLSYVDSNTWKSFLEEEDYLKSVTSVNLFKLYIKEHFFKKLGNIDADIIVTHKSIRKRNLLLF